MTISTLADVKAEIAATIHDMYEAFLADDRERFDRHLAAEGTTWESHFEHLFTRRELDEYRDRRAAAGKRPVFAMMRADILQVDVWDDTALARYLLITGAASAEPDTMRVTEVLRRIEGRWRVVHHHGQLREQPEGPRKQTA